MTVQLRRDSFARETLMREVDTTTCECAGCGAQHRNTPNPNPDARRVRTIYRYWWEKDGVKPSRVFGLRGFCSVRCWEDFYS